MEKINYPQLELFSQEQKAYAEARQEGQRSFFGYIRGYEKTILLIIAFTVTGIISFSLGVEKGKGLAFNLRPISADIQKPLVLPKTQTEQPVTEHKEAQFAYTIQLASYQGRASAQQEIELLKKRGLSPLILSKGKYIVLCVGNFSDKEKAISVLSEFEKQKRYKGCFIRRL